MHPLRGLAATLTLLAAVLPAAIGWWRDRDLLHRADDPALAELLSSRRRRTIRMIAIALAVMIVVGGAHAAWGIPLLLLLLGASAYPIRVRLLGETWRFGAFIAHSVASFIGGFGFWIALVYLPAAVAQATTALAGSNLGAAVVVAVVLMSMLVYWEARYVRLWLWTHAAAPLEHTELTARFEEIVRQAGTPAPRIYRVGPRGSRFINAIALPSADAPSVALGNALLDLLEPDETAAIFAHEVAHFDQFTPRWVRRAQWTTRALILIGGVAPLVATIGGEAWPWWAAWVWLLVIFAVLLRRSAGRQQRETESDLRAAELCGDPEALVRALVKLHLHARIPRRYAVNVERASTHPSLARRIQAIRGARGATSGHALPSMTAATVIPSTRTGSWTVFDHDRAYWLEGVPEGTPADLAALRDVATTYRAVSYHDLVELRVAVRGTTRAIAARPRSGAPWTVPIHADDVLRAQEALDLVDVHLAKAPSGAPNPAVPRIVALVAALSSILAGQAGVLLVPIVLVLFRAGAGPLAALGAMGLVRVAVGVVEGSDWIDASATRLGLFLLVTASVAAVFIAIRLVRAGHDPAHRRLALMVLGASTGVASLALVSRAMAGGSAGMVGSPIVAAVGTLAAGLGAALATELHRRARVGGFLVVVMGCAVAAVGTDVSAWTLRHALVETSARGTLASAVPLEGLAGVIHVSPNGTRFLATVTPAFQRQTPRRAERTVLGTFGEGTRELTAVAAAFVDDDRLLVLDALDQGVELRLEAVNGASPPAWVDTLSDVDAGTARVSVDAGSARWWVVSDAGDRDGMLIVAGRLGDASSARRVMLPDTLGLLDEPIVFGLADTVLAIRMPSQLRAGGLPWLSMLTAAPVRMEIVRVVGERLERAETWAGFPQCGLPTDGAAPCTVSSNHGMVLRIVRATGASTAVARLRGADAGAPTAGPGLRVASTTAGQGVVAVDLAARRLVRITLPPNAGYVAQAQTGDGWVVATVTDGRSSVIQRYQVSR